MGRKSHQRGAGLRKKLKQSEDNKKYGVIIGKPNSIGYREWRNKEDKNE